MLRFSGHDTFYCKDQWLLKGLQLSDSEEGVKVFRQVSAISELGVGKNMVRAILHWIKSFGLINEKDEFSSVANDIFLHKKYDEYIENEGTLWLLQYFLCKTAYSSIYQLVFSEFFEDKVSDEFNETQVINFLQRKLIANDQKISSIKTLESDFKVFVRMYVLPKKNKKTLEDDFNSVLQPLNLIVNTNRRNENGDIVYRLNKGQKKNVPKEVLAYCVLCEMGAENFVNFEDLYMSIGNFFCFSRSGFEEALDDACKKLHGFSYKSDAGIKLVQVKGDKGELKQELLKSYYE